MGAAVFYLLMLQKYISSKEIILIIIIILLCLGNISKDFTASNIKKTGLNGYVY